MYERGVAVTKARRDCYRLELAKLALTNLICLLERERHMVHPVTFQVWPSLYKHSVTSMDLPHISGWKVSTGVFA